jgi:hypothetical protein
MPEEATTMAVGTRPTPISTERFQFNRDLMMFSAEMSDLTGEQISRVFDGSVRMTLVSHRSGRAVVFALAHEERDREGELLWSDFKPLTDRGIAVTVRLYND